MSSNFHYPRSNIAFFPPCWLCPISSVWGAAGDKRSVLWLAQEKTRNAEPQTSLSLFSIKHTRTRQEKDKKILFPPNFGGLFLLNAFVEPGFFYCISNVQAKCTCNWFFSWICSLDWLEGFQRLLWGIKAISPRPVVDWPSYWMCRTLSSSLSFPPTFGWP